MDAKGTMSRDGRTASTSLAKDIVSSANSRDSGVIVIGKTGVDPGEFDVAELTADRAIPLKPQRWPTESTVAWPHQSASCAISRSTTARNLSL